jgi:hypothetical protein
MVFLPLQEQIRNVIQNPRPKFVDKSSLLVKAQTPPSSLKGILRCLSILYKKMLKTNIVYILTEEGLNTQNSQPSSTATIFSGKKLAKQKVLIIEK